VQALYPGLAYHPPTGRIVAWHGGDPVYSLDLETKVWTPHTYHGGPGYPSINGTYKRWSYSPALDVFVVLNNINRNAYLFRLKEE
jgi:hypothetical protein